MLIAHAPAGYLVGKFLGVSTKNKSIFYLSSCVLGAVVCDFDLIYQHYYDDMAVNHHDYWTHIPVYWVPLFFIAFFSWFISKKLSKGIMFFTAGVFSHLCLDSVLTGIKWAHPLNEEYYGLIPMSDVEVIVSPTKIHKIIENDFFELGVRGWVYNFASHWTFNIEIAIVSIAIFVFFVTLLFRCFHRS